ncbi:Eco57I restriction-modification methylase domain-containing protein [Limosilactobacillus fermentum]|uniref:Eco57I restriction-modification methylase domain-containing protein n=1 Tax=Limosilactobacillus fermentum TaxID=1613 RepID=UPI00128BDF1C|nr:hypothetical protein [Limosilactobacillus fermentum]MPW02516.1 hypothetical protein [Limosilactobacillus fermentum]
MKDTDLISSLQGDEASITAIATYLQYSVGKNPVDPTSDWRILFSDKAPDHGKGVIALRCEPNLTLQSKTIDVRRLYKKVEELKLALTTSFDVLVVGFVGVGRVVFFPFMNGNRDTRLDLNEDTITKRMYATNFQLMGNANLAVTEDEFGFGDYKLSLDIQKIFKRELTSTFLLMVKFYRKKLSELITSTSLKQALMPLVTEHTKAFLVKNDLADLAQQESYTAVLSTVVDTIILRQLMLRFLEGYYGSEAFEVSGISLGVGSGTLDDAIKKAVQVVISAPDDTRLKKINQKHKALQTISELDLFTGLFDDEELSATAHVGKMSDSQKSDIEELTEHAREQFATVYAGDLFSGSVGEVATAIEKQMVSQYPEFVTKMWVDTSSDQFSFRYEDMAPESLEKQYENSMSENVQIMLDQQGQPTVYYGDDKQEQKQKGAYYTDQRLVDYIVDQTVEKEFMTRYDQLKNTIQRNESKSLVETAINHLLAIKVVDMTCGGGSFLRGAFLKLASKHELLVGLNLSSELLTSYPMFESGEQGECLWEEYLLDYVIYGVDIDYKAVTIASLTLTLSSLQHRDANKPLPNLVGRTLIHQNSLMNTVPFKERDKVFTPLKREIAALRRAKLNNDASYEAKRVKLQEQVAHFAESTLGDQAPLLSAECLEINLPEVFFKADGTLDPRGGFTCVVGNPPWETWKPNSDEFYSQYDSEYLSLKNAKQKKQLQRQLQEKFPAIENRWAEYSARMAAGSNFLRDDNNFQYQSWTVDGRKTSSDLNLYKAAVERFYQCMQEDGRMGILTPDNLATDLGSTGLRHLLFEQGRVEEYLSFENRLGIFEGVDRRYKFAVLIMQRSKSTASTFKAFFYKHSLDALNDDGEKLNYAMADVHKNQELLSLVEPRTQAQFDVYHKMTARFPLFGETKPFKLGRDFDRTNDSEYFTTDSTASIYPLYEGKTFDQFTILYQPTEYATTEGVMKKVDPDQKEWRIAIRSVASATNKRSIIATLLPPNAVATHSVNIQKQAKKMTMYDKLFYVGILNSFVMDFYLRLLISMNVTQSFIKQAPIPKPEMFKDADAIVSLCLSLLQRGENVKTSHEALRLKHTETKGENRDSLLANLNARVAIEFGLSRDDLITLLQTFESPKHKKAIQGEAQRIINCYDDIKKGYCQ